MKKISILLLAVLFIGITNISAQTEATTEATTESTTAVEEVKEVKTCTKTGKVCDSTCEKKKNGTCCKGKKSTKGSFNFNKSNNYGGKSSCSKTKSKSCCKSKAKKKCGEGCTKPCCAKTTDGEEPAEDKAMDK